MIPRYFSKYRTVSENCHTAHLYVLVSFVYVRKHACMHEIEYRDATNRGIGDGATSEARALPLFNK